MIKEESGNLEFIMPDYKYSHLDGLARDKTKLEVEYSSSIALMKKPCVIRVIEWKELKP